MSTKERLAKALQEAGAPDQMVADAIAGKFDDFESDEALPIVHLVGTCRRYGLMDIASRAMSGEFDATKEEADAWYAREFPNGPGSAT